MGTYVQTRYLKFPLSRVPLLQERAYLALKKVPCPQSAVNGWSGAVLSPTIYALIATNPFNWSIATTPIPTFPVRYMRNANCTNGAENPYFREEILTVTATHVHDKHYNNTGTNVCHSVFDTLDTHVDDEFKTPPATAPGTTGWNATMLPNDMFDQLMQTYGKPTPDAVRQNNMTFYSAYNPKDPPKVLFKRFTNCLEVAIIAKVPYTIEQLPMNAVNLFTRTGFYTWDLDDWERKPIAVHSSKPRIKAALHPGPSLHPTADTALTIVLPVSPA